MTVVPGSLTTDQVQILRLLAISSSAATFIGCCFIGMSFFLFKGSKDFMLRLIFFLTLCDLGTSISFLLDIFDSAALAGGLHETALCSIQAAGIQFFLLGSMLWTVAVAHTLYRMVIHPLPAAALNVRESRVQARLYHPIVWTMITICCALPWTLDMFGDADQWCWIKGGAYSPYRFVFFYVWVDSALIFNFIVYVYSIVHVRRAAQRLDSLMVGDVGESYSRPLMDGTGRVRKTDLALQRTVMFYILVFLITASAGTANRIQNWIDPNSRIFWLVCLHATLVPLQGFLNAIVYGFNKKLRLHWGLLLGRMFGSKPQAMPLTLPVDEPDSSHPSAPIDIKHEEEVADHTMGTLPVMSDTDTEWAQSLRPPNLLERSSSSESEL